MKLLIVTQKIDDVDDLLGFFSGWIREFSKHVEKVTVICLEKGAYSFSSNVTVVSLGKEQKRSRLKYILNFYKYIWRERKNYDTVFVHMNQEYVLLAGLFWRLWGKKILLWRNHPQGSWTTNFAVLLAHKVYATSPYAYIARFKKTQIMPVGIDMGFFGYNSSASRKKDSILMLSRIAPIKKQDVLMEALVIVKKFRHNFICAFVGDALPKDISFLNSLKEKAQIISSDNSISFHPAVPFIKTPDWYNQYEIFVNATPTGSMDKTIFEAMVSGVFVLTSNMALEGKIPKECLFNEDDAQDLAHKICSSMAISEVKKSVILRACRDYVATEHSLSGLVDLIIKSQKI
ncbi:MAG TPA: glycosyltransferase [Candidatus Paceibacterota bacterium]|nr:glycosyltransferase [Candidatus Paceibacterota bacterium]